ncbi:MAG: hypothetical protein AAGM38_08515 [Pseudomonadota bacterium]
MAAAAVLNPQPVGPRAAASDPAQRSSEGASRRSALNIARRFDACEAGGGVGRTMDERPIDAARIVPPGSMSDAMADTGEMAPWFLIDLRKVAQPLSAIAPLWLYRRRRRATPGPNRAEPSRGENAERLKGASSFAA